MTEPSKNPGELPTHHGTCPYCGSAISVVIKDGTVVARCSHRGCGARGPIMRSLDRAVELFKRGRLSNAIIGEESPRPPIDMEPEPPDAWRCPEFDCVGGTFIHENGMKGKCSTCNGTGRKR